MLISSSEVTGVEEVSSVPGLVLRKPKMPLNGARIRRSSSLARIASRRAWAVCIRVFSTSSWVSDASFCAIKLLTRLYCRLASSSVAWASASWAVSSPLVSSTNMSPLPTNWPSSKFTLRTVSVTLAVSKTDSLARAVPMASI